MKSIYQLCNDKGMTIKQLFQEINKPFKFLKESDWRSMLNKNEFSDMVDLKICNIFRIDSTESEINTANKIVKHKEQPIERQKFKKQDFNKIKNLPKASDKLCTGRFGQCKSSIGVQRAHYTGEFQSLFGKGISEKVHDLFTSYLCLTCHNRLDQPKNRKSREASHEFAIAINLSRKIDFDNGDLIYKG